MSLSPELLDHVAGQVATWAGARLDALPRSAIARAVRAELAAGATPDEVRAPDPARARRLAAAASVGETYFFRHPEHFELVAAEVVPRFVARGGATFRAWSAGCATGEEAYSLAATLLGHLPPDRVLVLGSDLVDAHIEKARAAEYGAWSCRGLEPSDGLLVPAGRLVRVAPSVRERVRFEVHNLLWSPPVAPASQDLVLCRNVLVYLTPEAVCAVLQHLALVLAPGGVLIVGIVDVVGALPAGLERFGPASIQAYVRAPERRRSTPPSSSARRRPKSASARLVAAGSSAPPLPATAEGDDPVSLHLDALEALERGALDEADAILEELLGLDPSYLPGTLERALLAARVGRADDARTLMRDVLRRCEGRTDGEPVDAPEPMTVAYYRASAKAFLVRGGA